MPTSKPRITITLEPRVYDTVSRLAAASHRSMSHVVTDFLDLAQPQMERTVVILEAAIKAPDQAREDIRRSLERAESALMPALLESLEQTDWELQQHGIEWADLEAARRRGGAAEPARRPPKRGSPPVPVTRGVGTPKTAGKAQQKGRKRG